MMGRLEDLDELLAEMRAFGEAEHVPIINSRGLGVLLQAVEEQRPHRVLEIGTAIGYSALYIASKSAEDVEITSLELSEERAEIAQGYIDRSPFKDKIEIRGGDAGEALTKLSGKYDFVFIDAAKGQYPDYFRKIQEHLTSNAVIVADNVLFRGYVMGTVEAPRRFKTIVKRLREYIDMVSENAGYVTKIYENGDGLAVSKRIAK